MTILPITPPVIPLVPNATLFFQVPTGQHQIDPVTLNEVQIFEEIQLKAAIVESNNTVKKDENPGINNINRSVKGYILVRSLPEGLESSDRVRVTVHTSGLEETGTLFFTERLTAMSYNITASIGVPFEAILQTIGGG
jgi:hypothetical protein